MWQYLLICFWYFWCSVVSCSADMTVKLWDFQGYECVRTMHGLSFVSASKLSSVLCIDDSAFYCVQYQTETQATGVVRRVKS